MKYYPAQIYILCLGLFYDGIHRSLTAPFVIIPNLLFPGNMWAQGWNNIERFVRPFPNRQGVDVTDELQRQVSESNR